jgi:hypothetical protein
MRVLAPGLLALLLLAGANAAIARTRHVARHSGGSVSVSPGGVRITSGDADSTSDGGEDTLGQGPLVVDEGNGMVRFLSDATVRAGDRLDGDVVAIFGNVTVNGHVTGSAVAVFGSVRMGPGSSVGGDAVAVFGTDRSSGEVAGSEVAVLGSVELSPGASVGGDAVAVGGQVAAGDSTKVVGQTVSVSMLPLTLGLPALPVALMAIALGWVISLFFGWVFATLFPTRLARVAVTSSRRTFLSIVIAGLSFFLWPVAAVLIMCTIVGLPIGLVLLIVYPALVYAGQLAATYVLGCKLTRRRLGEGDAMGPMVAGSLLLAVFFAAAAISFTVGGVGGPLALFFLLLGLLVLLGLTVIGTGAFILSRAGSLPREITAGPGAGPAPAPEGANVMA